MKKLTACLALVGITLTLLYAVEPPPAPKLSKEAHWEAYEAALKKGLPKTAITHLNPIIEKTLADKDYAEAIKAVGKKNALEGTIQGNKAQEKIRRMEAEIKKAPAEMKLHLGRGLLDLGLHATDLFLRFVALDGAFEGVFLAHGLDGLGVILIREGFLDNRVEMGDGGFG